MVAAPADPIPTLRDSGKGYSDASIKELRELAKMLMQQGRNQKTPYYTWGNGLNTLTGDLMSGLTMRQADARERQTINNRAGEDASAVGGSGYTVPTGPGLPPPPPSSSASPPPMGTATSAAIPPAAARMPTPPGSGGAGPYSPFPQAGLAALGETTELPKPATESRSGSKESSPAEAGASSAPIPPNIDPNFVNNIRKFEGYSDKAYPDVKGYSIGYGSKATSPNEIIDRNTATKRNYDDIWSASKIVDSLGVPLTKGQREALTSLTMNTGSKWVNSGLGQAVKSGDWNAASQLFLQYNKAGGQVLPGLTNRRMAELKWAGAPDTDLTADAVGFHRTGGGEEKDDGPVREAGSVGAKGSPPASAPPPAAGGAPGVTPPAADVPTSPYTGNALPSTQFGKDLANYIYRKGTRGQQNFTPQDIEQMGKNILGTKPSYQVDPNTGWFIVTEPGKPPALVPPPGGRGFPPAPHNIPGTPLQGQNVIDPNTGRIKGFDVIRPLPSKEGGSPATGPASEPFGPSSSSTPPASAPGVAPAPPPVSPAAPRGVPGDVGSIGPTLTTPAPVRLASANPGFMLAQAVTTGGSGPGPDPATAAKLPTTSPPDSTWIKTLNDAAKQPLPPFNAGVQRPTLDNPDINALGTYNEDKKAYEALVTEQGKKVMDSLGKWADSIHEAGNQARKQQPSLKMVRQMLDNGQTLGLEQGPAAEIISTVKSLKQEAGRAAEKLNIPWIKEWAKQEGGEPNQVLTKTISTLTLENLRNMLGQNSGQFRVYELQLLNKAMGGDMLSPGAQKTVTAIVDKINDRSILYDKMAGAWEKKFGALDQRFRTAVQDYDLTHPTFQPDEFNYLWNSLDKDVPATRSPAPTSAPGVGTPPPAGDWKNLPGGVKMRPKPTGP